VDKDSTVWVRANDFAENGLMQEYPKLNDLYLDLGNTKTVENLLSWLQPPLSSLTIPSAFNTGPQELSKNGSTEHFVKHLGNIVQDYGKDLFQLKLLNAWHMPHALLSRFNGDFTAEELILGTKSPSYYTHSRRLPPKNWLHNFYGYNTPTAKGRWGSTLLRIHLGQIDLEGLDITEMPKSDLKHLRIMTLSPWYRANVSSKTLPSRIDSFLEGKLALEISTKLPTVRVICVGQYRFWRRTKVSSKTCPHLVHVEHLRNGDDDWKEMDVWMNSRDWQFLTHSRMAKEPKDSRSPLWVTDEPTIKQENYIVLYRKDD
jgi:hypothetical protein